MIPQSASDIQSLLTVPYPLTLMGKVSSSMKSYRKVPYPFTLIEYSALCYYISFDSPFSFEYERKERPVF